MYRHINRHINALLDLLRENNHVQEYDNLMDAFAAQPNAALDRDFQRRYAHFWTFGPGHDNAWRQNYFNLLQTVRNEGKRNLGQRPQLLKRVCDETRGNRGGKESLEFVFATKLVHMVDQTSPIYDDRVRAFYFLPHLNNGGDLEPRMDTCLKVYDALVREYARIIENGLLCHSIDRFRKEPHSQRFMDVKVIDSLIWAFVTWAKQDPAFVTGELRYE